MKYSNLIFLVSTFSTSVLAIPHPVARPITSADITVAVQDDEKNGSGASVTIPKHGEDLHMRVMPDNSVAIQKADINAPGLPPSGPSPQPGNLPMVTGTNILAIVTIPGTISLDSSTNTNTKTDVKTDTKSEWNSAQDSHSNADNSVDASQDNDGVDVSDQGTINDDDTGVDLSNSQGSGSGMPTYDIKPDDDHSYNAKNDPKEYNDTGSATNASSSGFGPKPDYGRRDDYGDKPDYGYFDDGYPNDGYPGEGCHGGGYPNGCQSDYGKPKPSRGNPGHGKPHNAGGAPCYPGCDYPAYHGSWMDSGPAVPERYCDPVNSNRNGVELDHKYCGCPFWDENGFFNFCGRDHVGEAPPKSSSWPPNCCDRFNDSYKVEIKETVTMNSEANAEANVRMDPEPNVDMRLHKRQDTPLPVTIEPSDDIVSILGKSFLPCTYDLRAHNM